MNDNSQTQPASTPYTVLARRFRPQTFEDVVGQEHVGQSLRNAIAAGRVAHAYLFTGARGVGKTSTARIFAKALNCPNAVDGVPCNDCELCRSISTGGDVDVLEIDGASNRGIDDIRSLRANVGVKSMRSRYKVYIIDEVHMLTKEAFNALLKTLEEPPPGVKFVFCTTEPNKVPDTILSRCQRFDFGMIDRAGIAARLEQIAEAEGATVQPDAIDLVARRGAGSMRDAQSLFDQLLAFGAEPITTEDVHRLLGTAPDDRLVALADALIDADLAGVFALIDQAVDSGVQLGSLSDQLLEYLRDLLIAGVNADAVPLLSVAAGLRDTLRQQADRWGLQTAAAAMQILADAKTRMQRSSSSRALLELALARIGSLEQLDELAQLAGQLRSESDRSAQQPAQRRSTARTSTGAGSASPKKKAAEGVSPLTVNTAEVQIATDPAETAEPLDFTEPNIDAFWSQLMLRTKDATASQLMRASHIAISGPNTLEIAFPRSYVFSKSYCQRAEILQSLKQQASDLAGRAIDVVVAFDESVPGEPAPARRAEPQQQRHSPSTAADDELVQSALAVFGGAILEVRSASAAGDK